MFKKILFIFLLLSLTNSVFADVDQTGKITRIIVETQNIVSVWLDGASNTTECTGGTRWTITSDDLLFKEKLSILIAAASSGKTVHLHHVTSYGCGNWNSNRIYYADVVY